jgi:predicted nuclease of predicted toxin-antitoxin system
VKPLLDEMIGPGVGDALRAAGIDTVAVVERTDLRALPDDLLLASAHDDERVMVTRNVADFARLDQQWHAEGRAHHGLVLVTEQAFPQNRNLVGNLVLALVAADERSLFPAPGTTLYLQPADRSA